MPRGGAALGDHVVCELPHAAERADIALDESGTAPTRVGLQPCRNAPPPPVDVVRTITNDARKPGLELLPTDGFVDESSIKGVQPPYEQRFSSLGPAEVQRVAINSHGSATSATDTYANLRSQYVPAGNSTGTPSRHRSRALAYAAANARSRRSASIRAHLLRDATRGRRFRRGSWLLGWLRHDCASTARRPHTRRPVRCRSRAHSASTAATRSLNSAPTEASGPSSGGIVSRISTIWGIAPSGRKKCRGRVARRHAGSVPCGIRPDSPKFGRFPDRRTAPNQPRWGARLPPAAQRILAPRQHLVEMLGELGAPTMAIVDHRVVVVRHRARQ